MTLSMPEHHWLPDETTAQSGGTSMMYGQPVQAYTSPAISAPRDWGVRSDRHHPGSCDSQPGRRLVPRHLRCARDCQDWASSDLRSGEDACDPRAHRSNRYDPTARPGSDRLSAKCSRATAPRPHRCREHARKLLRRLTQASADPWTLLHRGGRRRVRGARQAEPPAGSRLRVPRMWAKVRETGPASSGGAMGRRARRWPPATRVRGPER